MINVEQTDGIKTTLINPRVIDLIGQFIAVLREQNARRMFVGCDFNGLFQNNLPQHSLPTTAFYS